MKSATARKHVHRAFTLVELMVTIAIIAILASMIMFAMFSSQEAARVSKTRSTIAKLDAIIREKWESYSSRRVPIVIPVRTDAKLAAKSRLDGLRELMRMEMPERWTDIIYKDTSGNYVPSLPVSGIPAPAIWQAYLARYAAIRSVDPSKPTTEFQSAECLYLIVTIGMTEGGGRELFGESEMGDIDQDGMPEFWDAWGRPIQFLRWAPGFDSEMQRVTEPFDDLNGNGTFDSGDELKDCNGNKVRDVSTQPDPFDPMHVYPMPGQDQPTFALFPLIFSGGPDKEFDVVFEFDTATGPVRYNAYNNNPFEHKFGEPKVVGPIGFRKDTSSPPDGLDNSSDNIHNHLLGAR